MGRPHHVELRGCGSLHCTPTVYLWTSPTDSASGAPSSSTTRAPIAPVAPEPTCRATTAHPATAVSDSTASPTLAALDTTRHVVHSLTMRMRRECRVRLLTMRRVASRRYCDQN